MRQHNKQHAKVKGGLKGGILLLHTSTVCDRPDTSQARSERIWSKKELTIEQRRSGSMSGAKMERFLSETSPDMLPQADRYLIEHATFLPF
jgi:hypothetical protein